MPVKSREKLISTILVSVTPEMKRKVIAVAKFNQTSVNAFIREVLNDYLGKNKKEWEGMSNVE